jgi:hypothetical protein
MTWRKNAMNDFIIKLSKRGMTDLGRMFYLQVTYKCFIIVEMTAEYDIIQSTLLGIMSKIHIGEYDTIE